MIKIIFADDNPCSPGVVRWISNPNDECLLLLNMSFLIVSVVCSTCPFDCWYISDDVVHLKSHAAVYCMYSADAKHGP